MRLNKIISKLLVSVLTFSFLFVCGSNKISAATNEQYVNLGDYEYTVVNQNTIRLDRYKGTNTDIVVVDKAVINGNEYSIVIKKQETYQDFVTGEYTVIDSAFSNLTFITSITIKSGVVFEDNHTELMFNGCTKLTNVTFEDGTLTVIETGMFQFTNLKTFTVPNGVTEVYSGAFMWCENLEMVYFPNSVTFFDWSLMAQSMNVKSIIIDNNRANVQLGVYNNMGPDDVFNNGELLGGSVKNIIWLR